MENNGWRKFTEDTEADKKVFPYSKCFYQKQLYATAESAVFANIVEYDESQVGDIKIPHSFNIQMQIPEEVSCNGKIINVTCFSYTELDFPKMEADAQMIVDNLIK